MLQKLRLPWSTATVGCRSLKMVANSYHLEAKFEVKHTKKHEKGKKQKENNHK